MIMDTKALFAVLLVAGIIGGFSVNNYLMEEDTADMETETVADNNNEQVEVGSEAPDFTLTDTDLNEFNLSDYEGEKVLVVEFMNMNCGTCKNFESNTSQAAIVSDSDARHDAAKASGPAGPTAAAALATLRFACAYDSGNNVAYDLSSISSNNARNATC